MYCISCTFFCSNPRQHIQKLDTIVDFTKVDTSPSFKDCDSLIDEDKTSCFRTRIHKELANSLAKCSIKSNEQLDEIINVDLLIDIEGKVSLHNVYASEVIQQEIPTLDSLINISVSQLPKLRPANKRGIPVSTQYQLPIRIQQEN